MLPNNSQPKMNIANIVFNRSLILPLKYFAISWINPMGHAQPQNDLPKKNPIMPKKPNKYRNIANASLKSSRIKIEACSKTHNGHTQTAPGDALQKKYGNINPVKATPAMPIILKNRKMT